MRKLILLFLLSLANVYSVVSQPVSVNYSHNISEAVYVAGKIEEAPMNKGNTIQASNSRYVINLRIDSTKAGSEAYFIRTNGRQITITGGDERGMIYGGLSVAEDIKNGVHLENVRARTETQNYSLRAIKFNLPWDTYSHSYELDLHQETGKDLNFWKAFLDMMVENRFNGAISKLRDSLFFYNCKLGDRSV